MLVNSLISYLQGVADDSSGMNSQKQASKRFCECRCSGVLTFFFSCQLYIGGEFVGGCDIMMVCVSVCVSVWLCCVCVCLYECLVVFVYIYIYIYIMCIFIYIC